MFNKSAPIDANHYGKITSVFDTMRDILRESKGKDIKVGMKSGLLWKGIVSGFYEGSSDSIVVLRIQKIAHNGGEFPQSNCGELTQSTTLILISEIESVQFVGKNF